jgi:broad specificity phosphatase PhoE
MLEIYITRHSQNEDNVNGILNGHRDLPLTDLGRAQAHDVADHIRAINLTFDTVYTSPLVRASETARIITDTLNISAPTPLPDLIERDYGVMTGQKIADIEKLCAPHTFKAEIITYFTEAEGSEAFPDVLIRAQRVIEILKAKHTAGKILLVCHGDIGKMLYGAYYGLPWKDVLTLFHFGNGELILLSPTSPKEHTHVFRIKQENH